MSIMNMIVICKHCKKPEYYGDMRMIDGRSMCRACYKADYERRFGKPYTWTDLDGRVPTLDEYKHQQAAVIVDDDTDDTDDEWLNL